MQQQQVAVSSAQDQLALAAMQQAAMYNPYQLQSALASPLLAGEYPGLDPTGSTLPPLSSHCKRGPALL